MADQPNLTLGIDVGTSSVKMCLLDNSSGQIVQKKGLAYKFSKNSSIPSSYSQQSVSTIVLTIQQCLKELDCNLRQRVGRIGICGQMHGCVLWNDSFWTYSDSSYEIDEPHISDLFTWQDGRCTPEFLATLPKPQSYIDYVSTGFGCATIFWLLKNEPAFPRRFNRAGTIMDLLVTMICQLKKPIMSVQNASSWGFFDPVTLTWNTDLLELNGFPVNLLPKVVESNYSSSTKSNWLGIKSGTPVLVALGDMQCQVFANLKNDDESAVLNISTSTQLSFISEKPISKSTSEFKTIDYFPYFDGRFLAVAASLNGGNVLQKIVDGIKHLVEQIADVEIEQDRVWDKLIQLGWQHLTNKSDISVVATPFGERHSADSRASISNLSNDSEFGPLLVAVCRGLINNVFQMMPVDFLVSAKKKTLIGTGSALSKNRLLRSLLREKVNNDLNVVFIDSSDADVGVALICGGMKIKFQESKGT